MTADHWALISQQSWVVLVQKAAKTEGECLIRSEGQNYFLALSCSTRQHNQQYDKTAKLLNFWGERRG